MNTWWSDSQVRVLQTGDVMPLPLMVETNWAVEGWEVKVLLVSDVVKSGYSSVDVWTYTAPYSTESPDIAEADDVTETAIMKFGQRLREVLAGAPTQIRTSFPRRSAGQLIASPCESQLADIDESTGAQTSFRLI
ncbi:MAG: hypothetical protein QM650_00540 [Microlunatus sp.]